MRRLHLGCHLEDHDVDGLDCYCAPTVVLTLDNWLVVKHVDLHSPGRRA